jgi:hypothetical protein
MGSWLTKNKENDLAVIWKDKFTKSANNKSIKILNDIISNSRSQNNLSKYEGQKAHIMMAWLN